MASSSLSSKDIGRRKEDGEKRNVTSLDSVDGSECAGGVANTGADGEIQQEPGVAEKFLTASSSPSWYHSERIQRMIETKDEFHTPAEFEIEASRSHHSEVDPAVSETEHSAKANRKYFEVLLRRRYVREGDQLVAKQLECPDMVMPRSVFIPDCFEPNLVVGKRLAEGGQAEIYEARVSGEDECVFKVFKAGSVLQELEKQWPPALLKVLQCDRDHETKESMNLWSPNVMGATLLKDERLLDRFAFLMERRWGDLRKLIDQRMVESHNKGPLFLPT